MAFVDELKVHIKAGDGGDGVVRWRREKFIAKGGPAGGNGGKGGDVYLRGVRNSLLLEKYAHNERFKAPDGDPGGSRSKHGRDGEDLIIDVPVGTVAQNLSTGQSWDITKEGEIVQILRGGNGGLGNEHFKSATNQAPEETTEGKPGEEANFVFELELIADAGLVGFPNAGKSSLLNELTNAKSRIGAYQFTTLEPHLGSLYGFVIADIPGLIEGASEGRGLGTKFLKHIRRTRVIIHCLSLEEENPLEAYETIRNELKAFDPSLTERPEILVLTKMDAVTPEELARVKALFKDHPNVYAVSVLIDESIKTLQDFLTTFFRGKV